MSLTELPPGIEPNYIDPPDHRKQDIILHTVCLTLITCAVLMRTYTRTCISKSFGLDDCMNPFLIVPSARVLLMFLCLIVDTVIFAWVRNIGGK